MTRRVLRAIAIVIAVVAVIDPAVSSSRNTKPEIAVVAGDSLRDAALADRVERDLGERFTVIRAPFSPASATVLVGTHLPGSALEVGSPAFAVVREARAGAVSIEAARAPLRAALEARVPITATVRVTGAAGRDLEATLESGGAVIGRVARRIASDDARETLSLSFVPTAIGAAHLRVTARLAGAASTGTAATAPASAHADIVIDVRDDRWSVLFFDPRPSWLSTFVRRSIERDPRFVVTSRVVTSRSVSVDAGRPPATLGDPTPLAAFDAIIVGAGQALGDRDVAGLEAYLRRRGGTVMLLLDEQASGPYERLTRVRQWGAATSAAGFGLSRIRVGAGSPPSAPAADSVLRATSLIWPATLPPAWRVIAGSRPASGTSSAVRPIIWQSAVGAGQLIVSGALDAWRHRDPALSRFDEFWREAIAEAAAAGSTAIELVLASPVLPPGERSEVGVTVRASAFTQTPGSSGPADPVTALVEGTNVRIPITLWPGQDRGRYRASFRAPTTPGIYRLSVTSGDVSTDAPLIVSATATRPSRDDSDLIAAWASSRGGRAFNESAVAELEPLLTATLRPAARTETWYPMRSAWWIVPFALLLGGEWLARRRIGLA